MTDTVRFELSGPVATITLNRPDRLNAMTEELIGGVLACLEQASADDAIRVIVLTGPAAASARAVTSARWGSSPNPGPPAPAGRGCSGCTARPSSCTRCPR